MENIKTAMPTSNCVEFGKLVGAAKNVLKAACDKFGHTIRQVRFKLVQRELCVGQGKAFARIGGTSPDLKAESLPEFICKQRRAR